MCKHVQLSKGSHDANMCNCQQALSPAPSGVEFVCEVVGVGGRGVEMSSFSCCLLIYSPLVYFGNGNTPTEVRGCLSYLVYTTAAGTMWLHCSVHAGVEQLGRTGAHANGRFRTTCAGSAQRNGGM
jgi:hypothetical protein